jgi:hypothetical protein
MLWIGTLCSVRYCQICGSQISVRTDAFRHTDSVENRSDVGGECDEKLTSAEQNAD